MRREAGEIRQNGRSVEVTGKPIASQAYRKPERNPLTPCSLRFHPGNSAVWWRGRGWRWVRAGSGAWPIASGATVNADVQEKGQ